MVHALALSESLLAHDPDAILWVLCLDEFIESYLKELADPRIRTVRLTALEAEEPELARVKPTRSRIEYYFTLSPIWPLSVLKNNPAIPWITYVDADTFFFSSPAPIFAEMASASVVVTEQRHCAHIRHHIRFGRFNVGFMVFRNDSVGLDCLQRWRDQCLDWCYDREEDGKYADQKYLDAWPDRYGDAVCILKRKGVNLAPWSWMQYRYRFQNERVFVDDDPLELYHFARFRSLWGTRVFVSGLIEHGVMPWRIRQAIYGTYCAAFLRSRDRIRLLRPDFDFPRTTLRAAHDLWQVLIPRLLFGSDFLRIGRYLVSGRLGLGRFSGITLSSIRNLKGWFRSVARNGKGT